MLQGGSYESLLLCGVYVLEKWVDVLYYAPVVSSCLFNAEITGMFCDITQPVLSSSSECEFCFVSVAFVFVIIP